MVIVSSFSGMLCALKEALLLEAQMFKESQKLRMKSIQYAKQVGDMHIAIKEELANASPNNPITNEEGTFTSWQDFLDQKGFKRNTVTRYIDLAKNWDIVIKLGMQDESNAETMHKSMRLCRTVKIIKWYLEKLAAGCPEESLSTELYWEEEDALRTQGPTKRQLIEQVDALQGQLAELRRELRELKLENIRLRNKELAAV